MHAFPLVLSTLALEGRSYWQMQAVFSLWSWIQENPVVAICALVGILLLFWIWWDATRIVFAQNRIGTDAIRRAEALLRESIPGIQYEQLRKDGYLEVPSRLHRNRCYRIPRCQQRVQVVESGRRIAELCVITIDPVPDADLILAHKLMIEADEERYLAMANWIG